MITIIFEAHGTTFDNDAHLSEQTKKIESIYRNKLSIVEELKKSILSKAFKGRL